MRRIPPRHVGMHATGVPVPDRRERAAATRRKPSKTSERRAFFGGMRPAMLRAMRPPKPAICIKPAYGRDYKTQEAAITDWLKGKDFTIASINSNYGQYCSIRDFRDYEVTIYYNHLQNLLIWNEEK